ncbi:hypothetical protein Xen7305DRAFT_00001490 [Xenococcus sp. PCC 7305]|uniref:hypothetical protein n=1 Tax=Xenococcus sp. PCC 7305 TaxID=102125 RepID=UPI0002ABB09B|nr:hypothetical protein [Xenococcus sp. PCC 7305]ELS00448.1 hypothetical protein Xen7305DRAFT_00001490 [Xenococcus sp. PCC 7305]
MNYLLSDHNSLVWLYFILYAITIIFLVPSTNKKSNNQLVTAEVTNERALQFASQLVLRTVLIVPMLFLLKNSL